MFLLFRLITVYFVSCTDLRFLIYIIGTFFMIDKSKKYNAIQQFTCFAMSCPDSIACMILIKTTFFDLEN